MTLFSLITTCALATLALGLAQPIPTESPVPIKVQDFASLIRPSQEKNGAYHVDVSSDGKTLAVNHKNQVISVDLEKGKPHFHRQLPRLGAGEFYWMAFSPDNQTLAVSTKEKKVLFLDPRTGKTLRQLQAGGEVERFVFSPDGRFMSVNTWAAAEIWDLRTFNKLRVLADVHPWVFTADGQHVLTDDLEGSVHLISIATGKSSLVMGLPDPVIHYQFSQDGTKLATADVTMPQGTPVKVDSQRFVSVWDTRTHKRLAHFALTGVGRISPLLFAEGGKLLVAGTQQGSIAVWNLHSKKLLRHFQAHQGDVVDLELVQDRLFSAAGPGEVKIWNFAELRKP